MDSTTDYIQRMDQYQTFLVMEKGLSEKTIAAYSSDLMRFGLFLEKKKATAVSDIDTGLILTYLIHLRNRGLGARSRARHLVSLRGFFKFLTAEKIIEKNPAQQVDLPKTGLHLPDVLSVADVEALIDAPDRNQPEGLRDAAMLELLYGAGLRVSELIRLAMTGINLEAGFVRVFGKGSKERVVPVGRMALNAIQDYLDAFAAAVAEKPILQRSVCHPAGKCHDPAEFLEPDRPLWSAGKIKKKDHPPQLETLLCDAFARRGCRSSCRADDAGPRRHIDHPDLHPCRPSPVG